MLWNCDLTLVYYVFQRVRAGKRSLRMWSVQVNSLYNACFMHKADSMCFT